MGNSKKNPEQFSHILNIKEKILLNINDKSAFLSEIKCLARNWIFSSSSSNLLFFKLLHSPCNDMLMFYTLKALLQERNFYDFTAEFQTGEIWGCISLAM